MIYRANPINKNRLIEIHGKQVPLTQHLRKIGRIDDYGLIYARIYKQGMTIEEAINKPRK